MATATSLEELREHWQTFLDRLEKVWVKAERECQPVRRAFEPWQGTYKRTRRRDPLLTYLHHARNADQHTIQPVVLLAQDVRLKLAPGATATIRFDESTGTLTVDGDVLSHAVEPRRYALVPITDAGVRYNPPITDPIGAATSGLEFYTRFVGAAEKKFGRAN